MLQIIEIFQQYPWVLTLFWVTLVFLIVFIIERITVSSLRKFAIRKELPDHARNSMILISRLVIFLIGLTVVMRIAGLPSEIVIAITAMSGTAIGLASARTIGNIFAGIWILVTRPYHIGDYISLGGNIEGVVEEISLNYTKITTPIGETVLISNQRILDRDVVNYRVQDQGNIDNKEIKPQNNAPGEMEEKLKKGLKFEKKTYYYRYPLSVSFDTITLSNEKIQALLSATIQKYEDRVYKKPTFEYLKFNRLDKWFVVYISVKNPRDLFALIPQFLEDLTALLDRSRTC